MRSMKARAARLATMVAVLAAGLAVLAPVASAKVAVSFERLDGLRVSRDAGQVQQGRDPEDRLAQGEERARPEPGHLGQRGLLRSARP